MSVMRRLSLSLPALALAMAFASPAQAQEFQLRTGVSVLPLVGVKTAESTSITIGDLGYLGIDIAPGLRLAKVFTAEVALRPLIPISGEPGFSFLIAPGVIVDLWIAYARAAIPINISSDPSMFFEGALGISFLGSGYVGATVDYDTNGIFLVGAEAGWKISF
jgi:hypothetical protein